MACTRTLKRTPKDGRMFANLHWKNDELGNAVIGLYVRDYELWITSKKTKVARNWICELNERMEFQELGVTVKQITEFIRVQEKKFVLALDKAQELGLPSPAKDSCVSNSVDSALQIQFFAPQNYISKEDEVERICSHYKRLYHTLAPKLLPLDTSSKQNSSPFTSQSYLADQPDPVSPSSCSSTSTPPEDDFQFDDSTSSRGTPESESERGEPSLSLKLLQSGVSPISRHDSRSLTPSVAGTTNNPEGLWTNENQVQSCFTFHLPPAQHGDIPIPVPVPKPVPMRDLINEPAVSPLSERFRGSESDPLSFRASNRPSDIGSNRKSKVVLFGFPPMPIPDPVENSAYELSQDELDDNSCFVFPTPQIGGAPIPIPTPVSSTVAAPKQPPTPSLSSFFHDLSINTDSPELTESSYSYSEQTSISDSHTAPRGQKRKRDGSSTSENLTTIKSLHTKAVSAHESARRTRREARMLELEMAIIKAKEISKAKVSRISNHGGKHGQEEMDNMKIAHELRMEALHQERENIRREIRGFSALSTRRALEGHVSQLLISARAIRDRLLFEFRTKDSAVTHQKELDTVCDEMQHIVQLLQELEPGIIVSALPQLYVVALQISRICRQRVALLEAYSNGKVSRPYLQRRHRTEDHNPDHVLRTWFRENSANPYPTREEKAELSVKAGLSVQHIAQWFRNARCRGQEDDEIACELLPLLDFGDFDGRAHELASVSNGSFLMDAEGCESPYFFSYCELLESEL